MSITTQNQTGETIDFADGTKGFVYIFKGEYNTLETQAGSYVRGATCGDGVVANWTLERLPGDLGILRVTCRPENESGSGSGASSVPLSVTWSYRSVRCDLPIESYCGNTNASPMRSHIDAWRKETDETIKNAGKYRMQDGSLQDLTGADLALAGKIQQGIESVMRFYPMVVKVSKYGIAADPPVDFSKVGYIDTPSKTFGYSGVWLKCQDDISQNSDGTWTRTEGWMGAEKLDADLYGPNRWPMPYIHNS